ncbi:MAG: polymer-forming cytoskeletal protein [Oceanicaulis sp.]|uniref:polymer-forming cytoskeletal protein n=1 Tax=Glycocaulis sp. TaxID=1969725 RepID=UPI0025BCDACE|nr:polymer-forming cytoskeletal protein [Glycocaulis sp.]MCC5981345.1 polymer-forming cytoskeletal protein [Oceanicaulis sp.]MCH8521407.1 polymer-forming cytoskeletal protein [Glycocaulis sp.]
MKNRLLLSTAAAAAIILVACAPAQLTSTAYAQEGTRISGGDIRLTLNETGDARLTGADIRISGTVGGELRPTGADITMTAMSAGSLRATGADIRFEGAVGGDARVTGADISWTGPVGGDFTARGADLRFEGDVVGAFDASLADGRISGSMASLRVNAADLHLSEDSIIHGDARINAADLIVAGRIDGALRANVRTARLSGTVSGPLDIQADEGRGWFRRDRNGRVEISGTVEGGEICARSVVISGTVTGTLNVRASEPVTLEPSASAPGLAYTPRGDERCARR